MIVRLLQFNGVYHFQYPIQDLLHHVPTLEGMEVLVVATVGDWFLDEVIEGFSTARVFNSSIKLKFMGDSPQVFKPGMPVSAYVRNYVNAIEFSVSNDFSCRLWPRLMTDLRCPITDSGIVSWKCLRVQMLAAGTSSQDVCS